MSEYKLAILKLAAYYNVSLSDQQLLMYAEQLSRFLSVDETNRSIQLYVDDPKNEWFPKPVSKLIAIIQAPISNEDVSQNLSSILIEAERKYGAHWADGHFQGGEIVYQGKDVSYTNWRHAAISVFGETGLKVVERYGGWKNFCENIYESPDGVIRAQIVKLAGSLQNIVQKTGSYDSLGKRESGGLVSTSEIAKLLIFNPGGKNEK